MTELHAGATGGDWGSFTNPSGEVAGMHERVRVLVGVCKDHEERLRLLERAHWKMAGVMSLIAGAAAFAGAIASKLIK
jgi:hypothetical protein